MRNAGKGKSGRKFRIFCIAAAVMAAVGISGCQAEVSAENGVERVKAEEVSAAHAEMSTKEVVIVTETEASVENVDETVYVTGNGVNLRASASTSGEILAVLYRGEKLHRIGYSGSWSRVQYNDMVCYISSRYVSVLETETRETAAEGMAAGGTAAEGTAAGETTAGGTAAEGATAAETAAGGTAAETAAGLAEPASAAAPQPSDITLDLAWKYADLSKIHSGAARLYKSEAAVRKEITVCVNAGHGTAGGSDVKTLCHPDGSPKVTGGTTSAGATTAVAVSGGMTFDDGTPEYKVTLAMAVKLKDKLLAAGYDVVMIRESEDVQLDNIARTVIANNSSDCHIALHWDSTSSDKGAFYMSVPSQSSYRNMEPVKSNWEKHNALGESLIAGLQQAGVKIFSSGAMEMDLTQTSYSTIPSVDIELGDKASDHSDSTLNTLADGLLAGVNQYFGGSSGS